MHPYILGISALYHDSAAALCRGNEIVAAAQEERFTRVKHDASFPVNAIDFCLRQAKITPYEIDAIVYYDNPLLTLDRFMHNIAALGADAKPLIDGSFAKLFRHRLWVHKLAEKALSGLGKNGVFLVTRHHAAHAASAFYPSPFARAAILTLDGVGEWATTTIGRGENEKIISLKEINYPHSLGLLYTAFTTFCGFKANSGDYKLMGLAPYGKPIYADLIREKIIDLKPDGSFRLNLDYFAYQRSDVMTDENFAELFGGAARLPESEITRREMDIASSIQKVIEEVVIALARTAKKITGEKNLVMAGGVALNCVANGKLRREKIFDQIWIQPAAGDAGGALGAALFVAHQHFNTPRVVNGRDTQAGSALGVSYDETEITAALEKFGAKFQRYENRSELHTRVAEYLADGKVVGFFQGRMEYGPRALGNRSILADPRDATTQSRLNLKIKYRESFRPFAPSILAERAAEFFELDGESPYMLLCADVQKGLRQTPPSTADAASAAGGAKNFADDLLAVINQSRSTIPAVTHVDYSARVQTVRKDDNPNYYQLLKAFEKITDCPLLVNTSFNVRGEPLVCSPKDAYICFMRTEMDVLAIENFILLKEEQTPLTQDEDWKQKYRLDDMPATETGGGVKSRFANEVDDDNASHSRDVLSFYKELPFNYSSSAAVDTKLFTRENTIALGYPFLVPLIKRSKRVLDVGCGAGWFSISASYFYQRQVVGIDFNPKVIARAKENARLLRLDVEFLERDLFTYAPSEKFDFVSSQGVLHHTDNCREAVRKVLRDFIAADGYACIGLYHLYGRKPFLAHFRQLQNAGKNEEELFAEYRRLSPPLPDENLLQSWFHDQVLHPHETQHTLAEFIPLLAEENCELVSTSINRFAPITDLDAVLALEPSFEQIGNERLAKGQYYPGFFVFVARKKHG